MADQSPTEPSPDNGLCTDDARQLVRWVWAAVRAEVRAWTARLVEPLLSDPLPPGDDEPPTSGGS